MKFTKKTWGMIDTKKIILFTVSDPKTGFKVEITNYGASIVSVKVPDRDGNVSNIAFGHKKFDDFKKNNVYFGAVVGRVANRIAKGKFTLEGVDYSLFVNDNHKHCLHGGREGFNKKIWNCVCEEIDSDSIKLEFRYISPDGEENFPGTLTISTIYYISPMKIAWEFIATTDKTTIINITNHTYWNLSGIDTVIDDLQIKTYVDQYCPVDEDCLVIGKILPVDETLFKSTGFVKLSKILSNFGDIDNNFFISDYDPTNPKQIHKCAEIYSEKTGRLMQVETTEPCVQIYSGNFMEGITAYGKKCKKHAAICIEAQRMPNAINFPEHAHDVILKTGQIYFHKTLHTFSILE